MISNGPSLEDQASQYLLRLYEITNGNLLTRVDKFELGTELGLSRKETEAVITYLLSLGAIGGTFKSVTLTAAGLAQVRTITVPQSIQTNPQGAKRVTLRLLDVCREGWTTDSFVCLFGVSVVDTSLIGKPREKSETNHYRIKAGMTLTLKSTWRLTDSSDSDVAKVLFEHCREYVATQVQKKLEPEKELLLSTSTSPDRCPYDISRIPDPMNGISFIVETLDANQTDEYSRYEIELDCFLERLGRQHSRYSEALIFQQRLIENLTKARLHGDTPALEANRSQIVSGLDRLALDTLGVSFQELCK